MTTVNDKNEVTTNAIDWSGPAILLVDLDAFFASVEQLDHPQWRGKPVIVGGKAGRRGVVSTCSYEARAFGVHSAMASSTAERLCPDAIWASSHFDRYHEVSSQVMAILADESPYVERVSIDEAFVDVSPGRFTGEDPVTIAARIQKRVGQLGVTCSIGVASGKTTAKIASDMDKPRGLTVVYPGSEEGFLAPLPVRALPGIGARSAERLASHHIDTLGELVAADMEILRPIFGINTESVCERARGIDTRTLVLEREVKSVSHERTFINDLQTRDDIEDAIDFLASKVGRRLRTKELSGHVVTLKLRYDDLSIRTARTTLGSSTNDEAAFIPEAKQLISQIWRPGDSVRLVGVSISGFDEQPDQMHLFEQGDGSHGNAEIIRAADEVRDRFGDDMLKFGRELKLDKPTTGSSGNNDGRL